MSVANQRSTWLSQDAEVGVKWTWNLGLRANQDLIARGLVRPVVVHHEVDVQLGRDAKQATENVKSATTKEPASTAHSAKASAHKSKAKHHGTKSKAAAKEAVK